MLANLSDSNLQHGKWKHISQLPSAWINVHEHYMLIHINTFKVTKNFGANGVQLTVHCHLDFEPTHQKKIIRKNQEYSEFLRPTQTDSHKKIHKYQ